MDSQDEQDNQNDERTIDVRLEKDSTEFQKEIKLFKKFDDIRIKCDEVFQLNKFDITTLECQYFFYLGTDGTMVENQNEYEEWIRKMEEDNDHSEYYLWVKIDPSKFVNYVPLGQKFNFEIEYIVKHEMKKAQENIVTLLKMNDYTFTNYTVHEQKCNKCKREKMIGNIFKCYECDNGYLCQKCADDHEHPMLRIYSLN